MALLGVSIAVGLAAGLSVTELFGTVQKSDAVSLIEDGMGGILGHVAIIIGLGTMLGAILEVSGGAEALSSRLLALFGEKRAPLAMGLTGLIFGIPVFFDVGIFVLAPIVYAAAKRSGKSIVLYAMPLLAGLSMTHAFLPPHPGPVAAAGLLKVDLGWVILMGVVTGIPAVLAAWAYAAWIGNRLFVAVPQDMVEAAEEAKAAVAAREAGGRASTAARGRSPLGTVLAIIGTPLLLILMATFSSIALDPSTPRSVIEFFGHPFVALTIALLLAYCLLGLRQRLVPQVAGDRLHRLAEAGRQHPSGGRRGRRLRCGPGGQRRRAGAGGHLQRRGPAGHRAGLPALAGAARGPGLGDGRHRHHGGHRRPAAVGRATTRSRTWRWSSWPISAGSIFASHVNDGGFWIVSQYFGISERDTLKSWTVLESVLSVAGFVVAAAGEPGRVGRVRTWPRDPHAPWSRGSLFRAGPGYWLERHRPLLGALLGSCGRTSPAPRMHGVTPM